MKDYTNKISEKFMGNWDFAMSLPEKLNAKKHLGFDDWYLPDIDELCNMVDRKTGKRAPGTEHIVHEDLWSSSYDNACPDLAWHMYFQYGPIDSDSKGDGRYARCVRP